MNTRTTFRRGALVVTVAALLTASPASAQWAHLSKASTKCRTAIAKSYSKLVGTGAAVVAACHAARDKGDASLAAVDCNALGTDPTHVDPKGKYAAAVAKYAPTIGKSCVLQDAVLTQASYGGGPQFYVTCPIACPGVSDPITTIAGVAACQVCEATDMVVQAGTNTLGNPSTGLSKPDQVCHGAIAKGYVKYLATALTERTGCQSKLDAVGHSITASCSSYDTKGKVQKALDAAVAGVVKVCTPANLANLDACASDTVQNFNDCTASEWSGIADRTFSTAYEMPGDLCPRAIRTTIRGGCSVSGAAAGLCSSGSQTGTQLSIGWKGLGHGLDVTDSYTLAGDVACAGTTKGSCGTCTISGVSTDNAQYTDFTRCASDTSIKCTHPFSTDAVCGSTCLGGAAPHPSCTTNGDCTGGNTCTPGACRYLLGPPLAISAGSTPTCTLNVVISDITGTTNPDDGTSFLSVDLRSVVHSGESQSRPCPICRGDAMPQDGVKGGTCLGGLHDGGSCDVQGFDLSFAPTDAAHPTAGNSLDCPPSPGANISSNGLALTLPLTTGTVTKTAQDPCESPNGSINCFCGDCSLDSTVPCDTDTDCSSHGLGVCGASGGVNRKPNLCGDGICYAVPGQTDRGECDGHSLPLPAKPADFDKYCGGLLMASGHGVLACNTNGDCDSYISPYTNEPDKWVCPGNDCGQCDQSVFRSCFMDPISITGTPDPVNPILVGAFCLPPSTGSPTVNLATGSPGPGVVQTDSIVELRY